jgi:ABC-type oligopeptide transport system substrate-binding subunit
MKRSLRVSIGEPSGIEPAHGFEHDGALILRFTSDPLVDFTPDSGEIRPAAARAWRMDESGRRILFQLRPGVRFHHGRLVTAGDYVYSLSRVVRPETGAELAPALGMIEGYDEVRRGRQRSLHGARALDPMTLEIRFDRPFHEAPALFGHRVTAAVPEEVVEADPAAFAAQPIGTGPYRVSKADCRRSVELERFDGYYCGNQAFADGGGGQVDALSFQVYEDVSRAMDDWLAGRLEVTKVPPPRIGEARAQGPAFRCTPCALMQYLGLPVRLRPFDNPSVRRAIARAIDRPRLIEDAFSGTRPLANRILPPALAGEACAGLDLVQVSYDPERARRELAGLGVLPLNDTELRFNAGLGHDQWVDAVVEQLNSGLGWRLRKRAMAWPDFLRWLPEATTPFRMTWAIDYPSVDNVLFPLFHSDALGTTNLTGFSDGRVDRLIEQARATSDPVSRRALYADVERLVCRELPLIPLWFGVQYNLVALDRLEIDGRPVDIFGEPALRGFRWLT